MTENGSESLPFEPPEQENIRLREENARLRRLLSVHSIPIPQLASENPPPAKTTETAPPVNKEERARKRIALFRDLFRGREDVYARRWENDDGRHGYMPAAVKDWDAINRSRPEERKKVDQKTRRFLQLTDAVIENHLTGRETVGVYPLLSDETCWFLAADFDKKTWEYDSQAFLETCLELSVPAALERSRSGKGGHIWIFFDRALPAITARKLGCLILTRTMERRHQVGLDSYDRFFPNQDTMPKGGLGNLIALPLQFAPRKSGNSVFIDSGFNPYPDQWQFLSTIRRLSAGTAEEIVAEAQGKGDLVGVRMSIADDEAVQDPWTLPPSRKRKERPIEGPLPKTVQIVRANLVYVEKKDLPPAMLNRLLRLAAFQNPEFYKAQAMRLSTYDKPRVIACGQEFAQHIAVPRGCLTETLALLEAHKIRPDVRDERFAGTPIEVEFQGQLRPFQEEAVAKITAHDEGILCAPTAFGKTAVAAWLIAKRKVNTLVVVHRQQLLDQWQERLGMFLDLPTKSIGHIGGGKTDRTGCVDVAVIQSLYRKDKVKDFVAEYGQVIVDECHHISAFTFEQVMRQVKAKYVVGLTATPTRKDGHHPIIYMQCGPVRFMIAAGEIFADLSAAVVSRPAEVTVFANAEVAGAFHHISGAPTAATPGRQINIEPGEAVSWDGTVWRIVNVGDQFISLLGENGGLTELPCETLDRLIAAGRLESSARGALASSDRAQILSGASEADLREANRRFDLVKRHMNGEPLTVSERTLRFWTALYREGREEHGSGYLGLLPRVGLRGNRTSRLPRETKALVEEFISKDYETLKQKSKLSSWALLKAKCEERNLTAPTYKTFCIQTRQRPVFEQTMKRKGSRAAYADAPLYLELHQTTTRHGDRPFEIGHIDHTELDVELVCSATGRNLGRPWMTILVDAFSRRGLALYLTFDPPSYRACMMILRECVRRHGRLPQIIVIDGGAEFQSTYFETLLARYECIKKTRPPAKARFGSVCERLFGTTNTQFVHNLRGNTQITRNVRQVTKSVNPKELAAWTLGDLHDRASEYLYEVYDMIDHPALGQSPREAFRAGLEIGGSRAQRMIPYDQEFLIATLPTTPKGTALVAVGRGVKINQIYYWSDRFLEPGVENESVPVRYDPFDLGTAYAYVRKQWVACRSQHFGAFRGRSEKEVMIASREILKRRQEHSRRGGITARRLADFLISIESEEVLLQQRLRDRESAAVRNGSAPARPVEGQNSIQQDHIRGAADPIELSAAADLELYGEF